MEQKPFVKYIAFFTIGVFLTAGIFLSYSTYASTLVVNNEGSTQNEKSTLSQTLGQTIDNIKTLDTHIGSATLLSASIPALAVNSEGASGVVSSLSVDIIPGKGGVLLDTNYILAPDTQYSATQAVLAAKMYTKNFPTDKDFVFHFNNVPTKMLGGPSAGAAMALLTTSLLEGKPIKNGVSITGTMESDGTIGPIGGIVEKIRAAGETGLKLLLIPKGQGMYSPRQEAMHQQQMQQQMNGGMNNGMPGMGMPMGGQGQGNPFGQGAPMMSGPQSTQHASSSDEKASAFQAGSVFDTSQADDTINLMSAAKEKWGLEVIEVANLADAAKYALED